MSSFGSLTPSRCSSHARLKRKECANLFHLKRRVDVAQFDHNHVSKRHPRQKPGGPHFTLAGCKPLDGCVGRVRELEENIGARGQFLLRILLQRRFRNSRGPGKPAPVAELFDEQHETTGEGVSLSSVPTTMAFVD
jgi:hypothetical protein